MDAQSERSTEEILRLRSILKKEKVSADEVNDVLNTLGNTVVNREILKKTRIVKLLNSISLRADDFGQDVVDKTKALIKEWKAKYTKRLIKPGECAIARSDPVSSVSFTPVHVTENFKRAKSQSRPSDLKVDFSTEGVAVETTESEQFIQVGSVELPDDKVRNRVCTLLKDAFKSDAGVEHDAKLAVAVSIESAMMNEFGMSDCKEYKAKFRTLKFNLSKNSELRKDLIEGLIDPRRVVIMKPEELADPEKRRERQKAQEDIFNASRTDWLDANRDNINRQAGIKAIGGLFKCWRCKSEKTTHYQKQTRSADEPMTVFVQCTQCGNRWRFSG